MGTRGRRASFVIVGAAYIAAVGAFVLTVSVLGRESSWWSMSAGFVVSTTLLYVVSQLVGNGSTFDPWWSVMPPVAAIWLMVGNDQVDLTRRWLVVGCVVLWGVRLTANWAASWPGLHHEDWRYVELYGAGRMPRWLVSLLGVHLVPTIIVALACLPLVAALTSVSEAFGPLDIVATVFTLSAITLELAADNQLRRFNRAKQVGDVLDTGLWARSRHPNYLGEIGFWWGLWLFALAGGVDAAWTVIGPIEITVMFVAVSIPLSERRSAARRLDWFDYAERTPTLLPRLVASGTRSAGHR
ncbi:MAG: DUF1295 domain-containing protein [Acidimicrobiia bacterium]